MKRKIVGSPVGALTLLADGEVISGLYFGECCLEVPLGDGGVFDLCSEELAAYFDGRLQHFSVPFLARGTLFRELVWGALLRIPYGETVSYRDIAVDIGNPRSVRAVGGANHNNPISIIIPCHRVVGANGSLTGYGGGICAKRWLLDLEAKYKDKEL